MMRRFGFLLLFLSSTLAASASDFVPIYEVVAGGNLETEKATFLQLTLTHDVYRYTHGGLRNLVVLDKDGAPLPYRIARSGGAESPNLPSSGVETRPVPFYPVRLQGEAVGARTAVKVRDKTLTVDIGSDSGLLLNSDANAVDFYLIDLGRDAQDVAALLIDWPAGDDHQYVEVEISGTRDLQQWTRLARTTLVQLERDGKTLRRDRVELNVIARQYPYLRLAVVRGNKQLQVDNIRLEQAATRGATPTERWQVRGEKASSQRSALRTAERASVDAWEFVRADTAPVERLTLELGEQTYGGNLIIYSRTEERLPWQRIYEGVWFNTRVGEVWQQSSPLTLSGTTASYWRVEFLTATSFSSPPILSFSRTPDVLQFIGNERPPYRIAVDVSGVDHISTSAQIFRQVLAQREVNWQVVQTLALEPDIQLTSRAQSNWRAWLFWSLLLIAVAVLIVLAVRLFRQMSKSE